MNDGLKDISASVRARLINLAREQGRTFQELLFHYGMERFLYRLSESPFRDEFILKGGLLFEIQQIPGRRYTRDIDLRSYSENSLEMVRKIISEVCDLEVNPDGLFFDPDTIQVEEIRKPTEPSGLRVRMIAYLGSAEIPIQLDLGFSDEIFPDPVMVEYPTLLEMQAPRIRRYPWESVIAEKFEAMIHLGEINSRMKDFYDIWLLSSQMPFDGDRLKEALRRTFTQRQTFLPDHPTDIFGSEFADKQQLLWSRFAARAEVEDIPDSFAQIIGELMDFLIPLCVSLKKNENFSLSWKPGRGWE